MPLSTVLFLIVLIVIVARHRRDRRYLDERLDAYLGENERSRPRVHADADRLEQEVAELRERIRVLERIAIDNNSAEARHSRTIAEEIESLRDKG